MAVAAVDVELSRMEIVPERDRLRRRLADVPGAARSGPEISRRARSHEAKTREHDDRPEQGGCCRCEKLRHRPCRAPLRYVRLRARGEASLLDNRLGAGSLPELSVARSLKTQEAGHAGHG